MSRFLAAVALSVIASPKGEATSPSLLRFARSDVAHCPLKTETTPLSSHPVWDSPALFPETQLTTRRLP